MSEHLAFYDAISPIVLAETIDMSKVFRASRWDRSLRAVRQRRDQADAPALPRRRPAASTTAQGDYLNCPMTQEEYDAFYDALVSAESATVHDFDKAKFFEGLPADRGDGASRRATRCASAR